MEIKDKLEILNGLGMGKRNVIESLKNSERSSFSEVVDKVKITKTIKGEFHKARMRILCKEIREMINDGLITDSHDGVFAFKETFRLTDFGRTLIMSDKDILEEKLVVAKRSLRFTSENFESSKASVKGIEEELNKLEKRKDI